MMKDYLLFSSVDGGNSVGNKKLGEKISSISLLILWISLLKEGTQLFDF